MPSWLTAIGIGSGGAITSGLTKYQYPIGYWQADTVETWDKARIRDSYTLSKLYVRVNENTLNGSTTVRSRINGVNGNQSVSIGAAATGAFEDNINSDGLVDDDLLNTYHVVGGASGLIRTTSVAYRLSGATSIRGTNYIYGLFPGNTYYFVLMGHGQKTTVESVTQYTFRVAATLSNFRAFIQNNTITAASTVRTRKNGANGNQSFSVPDSTSGDFEDTSNTDSVVPGDNFNYQVVIGATGTEMNIFSMQHKSNSTGKPIGVGSGGTATFQYNWTRYTPIEGSPQTLNATESLVQIETRTALIAKNMFVRISANSIDNSSTFTLRKNTADTALAVSVGAAATGVFEDTADTIDFDLDDLINWKVVSVGTAGTMIINYIAFEQRQPPVTVKPSANMGSKMVAAGLI